MDETRRLTEREQLALLERGSPPRPVEFEMPPPAPPGMWWVWDDDLPGWLLLPAGQYKDGMR